MWTHPAKRLLQSEIICSSPLTVRFIFYALNPSVLIVCVASFYKKFFVFGPPPPPPPQKKKNLVKVDNITRPLSKLGRAVFEQLFDEFFLCDIEKNQYFRYHKYRI